MRPSWIQEPKDVKAQLNEEVLLNCSTKAFPEPTTKWFQLDKDSKFDEFKKLEMENTKSITRILANSANSFCTTFYRDGDKDS